MDEDVFQDLMKDELSDLERAIMHSDMTLEELIFGRLDMTWIDLFYDLYYRIQERTEHFEDLS